jgi:acyl carrier protein
LAAIAPTPKLFLVTGNAPAISESDRANPADAVLWGLGRTLALEHPDSWGGVIDIDEPRAEVTDTDGGRDHVATMPTGDIKDVWRTCPPEQRRTLLRDHVSVLVAAVMGLPSPQALDPSADFFELGMDSLMSVLLQRALDATLEEEIPQSALFDYPTVEALADHLVILGDVDGDSVDSYEHLTEVDLPERVS